MPPDDLVTTAFSRLIKLGGLAGRVGVSMTGNAILGLLRSVDNKESSHTRNLEQNALRIAKTLGQLKGVPMKLGQMVSLHEGFLPPEVVSILSLLQKKAPPVAFASILNLIKEELGEKFNLIERINPEVYAAASIGQVHKAFLKDGREVVFKVQYPGIDKVITADMKNLKRLLELIFSMISNVDMSGVWEEMNQRLLEEVDYEKEASGMRKMAEFHRDDPLLLIPEVISDVSSRRVLCMTLLEGISPEEACSDQFSSDLRNKWGRIIFEFELAGIFRDKFLHADPNLANFSFLEDGRVIVYDFGCTKEVPDTLATGYAKLVRAVLDDKNDQITMLLDNLGVRKSNGKPLPDEMILRYAELFRRPFQADSTYTFGQDESFYDELIHLGKNFWTESLDIEFPKDFVFIDRTISGHFGNLCKLRSTAPWREILEKYIKQTD